MADAMQRGKLTREDIETLAREHEVCPYELAIDLVPWVDLIIGDLHYVYSLSAVLGRSMETDGTRWTVLLDEAHNLPGRARRMYSASIGKHLLMQARKETSGSPKRALDRCNRALLALNKDEWQEENFHSFDSVPAKLLRALQELSAQTSRQLAEDPAFLQRLPRYMDFYFEVLQFLRVAENWGDEYRCELSRQAGAQSLVVTLNCLDPARLLAQRQAHAHAVVAFSATLTPQMWARSALGLSEDAVCSRSESPFSPDQLRVSLATDLDTRYQQRQQSLPALVDRIDQWLQDTQGNCIVYFPSYRYMRDVVDLLPENNQRQLWVQQPDLSETGRDELLALLEQHTNISAFCILGGVFGEGIDLPGDRLRSVVVVGVGMPQVNRDTRQLQEYHQQKHGAGFDHTFLYPGMQKVDQALGRVVRTLDDRGTALLIDTRYSQQQYRALLPPWWEYRSQET